MTSPFEATPPANDNKGSKQDKLAPCPICGRPASKDERPFCSRRCTDIDLHRWLGGVYVVPGEPADDDLDRPSPLSED